MQQHHRRSGSRPRDFVPDVAPRYSKTRFAEDEIGVCRRWRVGAGQGEHEQAEKLLGVHGNRERLLRVHGTWEKHGMNETARTVAGV
jgi:hypothetical protein